MAHGEKPGSVIKKDSTIISNQGGLSGAEKPFDAMNNIVANLLLNITRYNNTVMLFCYTRETYHSDGMRLVLCASILQQIFALDGHALHNIILYHKDFPYRFFEHLIILI